MGFEALLMGLLQLLFTAAPSVIEAIRGSDSTESALANAHAAVKALASSKSVGERVHDAGEAKRLALMAEAVRAGRSDEITREVPTPSGGK